MKKKKIELNAKLFLRKTTVSLLNDLEAVTGGAGNSLPPTNCPSTPTSPCAICTVSQRPTCTQASACASVVGPLGVCCVVTLMNCG